MDSSPPRRRFTGAAAVLKLKKQEESQLQKQQRQELNTSMSSNEENIFTPPQAAKRLSFSTPNQYDSYSTGTSAIVFMDNCENGDPDVPKATYRKTPHPKVCASAFVTYASDGTPQKFLEEVDESLEDVQKKVQQILRHNTSCQSITLALHQFHNVDIWKAMKSCNIATPMEFYKHLGFNVDNNECLSLLADGSMNAGLGSNNNQKGH